MKLIQPPKSPSGIKLMLEIEMPTPQVTRAAAMQPPPPTPVAKAPVEQKIKDCLEKIDSGHDSHVEWITIRNLYKSLRALKNPNDRALNIMKQLEPVLAKYGYAASVETDGNTKGK